MFVVLFRFKLVDGVWIAGEVASSMQVQRNATEAVTQRTKMTRIKAKSRLKPQAELRERAAKRLIICPPIDKRNARLARAND